MRKKQRQHVRSWDRHHQKETDPRLRVGALFIFGFAGMIVLRLFILMIMQHGFYTALAAGSHDVYAQLFPARGSVYIQDSRTGEEYPLAINRDLFTVFADTTLIAPEEIKPIQEALAEIFSYDDEQKEKLFASLSKEDDPYEPIEQQVEESIVNRIKEYGFKGIGFARTSHRFYPEDELAAHVIGFLGKTTEGEDIGQYGIEGYWQHELAGKKGFFEGERSAAGFWIPLAGRSFEEAIDGSDILLTLDRTLEYTACNILRKAALEYGASGASLVVMDPQTGAIRAMCSVPEFNPNSYNKVESIDVYNNSTIFTQYEPGSIFKPIAMAAALNEGVLTPEDTFFDSGSAPDICDKPIRNADLRSYDLVNMTEVLENSINTGMVYTVQKVGKETFRDYIEQFGFEVKTGIEIDREVAGNISTLRVNKKNEVDCYTATASFGQGITATPLQMVSAYTAIANGGTLLKPYIVEEIRHQDGRVERFGRKEIQQVLDRRTASLLSGMLVSVVDNGQATAAQVDGYYLAGKTGTAQIAGPGGYTDQTNHSFVGFGPVEDPQFVMIVKFEKPQRTFSSTTAAPTFSQIASFLLQYYQIPPTR